MKKIYYMLLATKTQGSWSDFGKLGKVSTNSTGFTTRGNKEKSDERSDPLTMFNNSTLTTKANLPRSKRPTY